ncbi:hypothetical protein M8C21_009987, partial [Ambrosia artemisiifolia]
MQTISMLLIICWKNPKIVGTTSCTHTLSGAGWFTRKKKENRTQGLENAKTTNLVWLEQRSDQSFTFYVTSADKVVLECRTLGIMLCITINTPEQ